MFLSSSEPEKDYINASFVDVSKLIVIFSSHEVYSTTMWGVVHTYHFYCRWFEESEPCIDVVISVTYSHVVKISREGIEP